MQWEYKRAGIHGVSLTVGKIDSREITKLVDRCQCTEGTKVRGTGEDRVNMMSFLR